jgi:hypothetical protein
MPQRFLEIGVIGLSVAVIEQPEYTRPILRRETPGGHGLELKPGQVPTADQFCHLWPRLPPTPSKCGHGLETRRRHRPWPPDYILRLDRSMEHILYVFLVEKKRRSGSRPTVEGDFV